MTSTLPAEFDLSALGTEVASVDVQIDYDIITHFSQHLYASPNKAIEELVSNGYDAFATKVWVYIPGSFLPDRVIVWDNGLSMDLEGLHHLWWIAKSPKNNGDRIAVSSDGKRRRQMIGKFGIGKLASYAIGQRISHLCRRNDEFLLIGVDYRKVPHIDPESTPKPYPAKVQRLTESEARSFAESLFLQNPQALSFIWASEHWTMAIVDALKPETSLHERRLRWVLGNGMPLRPDFEVFVNDQAVEPKAAQGALHTWQLDEPRLIESIESAWKQAVDKGDASGNLILHPASTGTGRPSIEFPNLGHVYAEAYLFTESQKTDSDEDFDRGYGFFVKVRDRLINPEDAQLFLQPPSYGTFYRCQFVIHADGLDVDLLANREQVQRTSPRAHELTVLQRGMYRAARITLEKHDEAKERAERSESLLPVESRRHFYEPLASLLVRRGLTSIQPIDLAKPQIDRVALGYDEPIADVSSSGVLRVNDDHPLLRSFDKKFGESRRAQEMRQFIDLLAVSERLLEGFLYDRGLSANQVDDIIDWREGLFRSIALRVDASPLEDVVREVREASYLGGKRFEDALANMFRLVGFEAERDGASGKKDILAVAPIGTNEYRITIEAKGSNGAIANDDADVSAAAAHRDEVGAQLAIIVARAFSGFASHGSDAPAILKECNSTGGVSIMTVEALIRLFDAVRTFHYPLEHIYPILEKVESPDDKLMSIESLQNPAKNFDVRGVLDAIWAKQRGVAAGDRVPYRSIWQEHPNRWGVELKEFETRLQGLATMSGVLLILSEGETVTLHQNPEIVVMHIAASMKFGEAKNETPTS